MAPKQHRLIVEQCIQVSRAINNTGKNMHTGKWRHCTPNESFIKLTGHKFKTILIIKDHRQHQRVSRNLGPNVMHILMSPTKRGFYNSSFKYSLNILDNICQLVIPVANNHGFPQPHISPPIQICHHGGQAHQARLPTLLYLLFFFHACYSMQAISTHFCSQFKKARVARSSCMKRVPSV